MPQIIQRFDAAFTTIDQPITLSIPQGSEEVALRVYRDQTPETLSIFVLMDVPDPANPVPTYERTFELILAAEVVPVNYKKYVATMPFGPSNEEVHIIELMPAPAKPNGFTIEQVS
jgi:hypothetical protein